MAKNVEININNGSSYEVIYPKASLDNVINTLDYSFLINTPIHYKIDTLTYTGTGEAWLYLTFPYAVLIVFIFGGAQSSNGGYSTSTPLIISPFFKSKINQVVVSQTLGVTTNPVTNSWSNGNKQVALFNQSINSVKYPSNSSWVLETFTGLINRTDSNYVCVYLYQI